MADTKISGLAAGAPAQSGDLIPIARSGANYSITPANILNASLAATFGVTTGTTFNGSTIAVATRQVFLTGTAATYTTPANCRRIVVRMKGAGGGGAGSADATANATAGGAGGTTIFNSINANGGGGGTPATGGNVTTAKGGNAGTGTASVRIAGATGGAPQYHYNAATTAFGLGGVGGGQGGGNNTSGTGGAGTANSGGGGAGGPNGTASAFATIYTFQIAPAGGEGEYAEIAISSPAASYTYTVGAGGTAGAAGTNGNAGGVGGSGYIIVDEYY